jgi:trk system potassium uptake protein TrkA
MKRFLVIGLGRFGMSLAETLYADGAEVIAIDELAERVEEIKEKATLAVQLDSTDSDALKSVGADRVDAAIIAIGEDFEASVVTTAVLKDLGLKEIIVRAYTKREKKILQLIGASRVIFIEQEMGRRLAKTFSGDAILDYIEISSTHSIVQWEVPDVLIGSTLGDLKIKEKWNLNLFAIKKEGTASKGFGWRKGEEKLEFSPPLEYLIVKGDIMVLLGRSRDLTRFTAQKK